MNNNNVIFKILFAVIIASLPLIILGNIAFGMWLTQLFICLLLISLLWLNLLKDNTNKNDIWLCSLASLVTVEFLMIYYMAIGFVPLAYGLTTAIVYLAYLVLRYFTEDYQTFDILSAIDMCNKFFVFITLALYAVGSATFEIAKIANLCALVTLSIFVIVRVVQFVRMYVYNNRKFVNKKRKK